MKRHIVILLLLAASPAFAQGVIEGSPGGGDAAVETFPVPDRPAAEATDPNSRTGESLAEPRQGSDIPKALRSSGSRAGGPANDLNPGGRPEPAAPPKGELGAVIAGEALFHGNYCGKGQRGEGLPPVDELDAACQRHDACYDAAGGPSCDCDKALGREATKVADAPGVALEVRRRALSVVEASTGMACR